MTYAEMLDQIIKESQLSLRQIAKRCADLNLHITPSYISQLKNGKLPPPSEEVSLVLSKVCGAKNQAYLVFQGYMDKAPKLMKEYMLASSSLNKVLMEALCKASDESYTMEMEEYIKSLDVLAALELSSRYISEDDPVSIKNLVQEIALSSGALTKADGKGDLFSLFHGDTSMSPTIPIHAYVYIMPTKKELLKDKDIVAFYPDKRKTPVLRRLFFVKSKVVLMPDDRSSEPYFFETMDEVNYVGKVVSYKIDL